MGELKCYVVSYDIMDPKRLHRVHKTMKGFGDPIHYSVFRCLLTAKGKVELVAALTESPGDTKQLKLFNPTPSFT